MVATASKDTPLPLGDKCSIRLTADGVLWAWVQEHAAMVTNAYSRRADGRTSWEAAFGCGYDGEVRKPSQDYDLFSACPRYKHQASMQ